MKNLLFYAEAQDFIKLTDEVFLSYFGSADCAKLPKVDRNLVIDLYRSIIKYFYRKEKETDEKIEKMEKMRKEQEQSEKV